MRGKRSKQYRKLMHQYQLNFGFREPYQVLVDAQLLRDADRFKMDLVAGLERTLHGQVKPTSTEPGVSYLIDKAKTYERRRCGHLPTEYPEPLSTETCITSVIDPKNNKTNKHRYVVASQDVETRKNMREILGVPLVYINRSVMIMEPMAGATAENREREERGKFRDGLKRGRGSGSLKRKRDDELEGENRDAGASGKKKMSIKKVKGPNPLAMKKPKKRPEGQGTTTPAKDTRSETVGERNSPPAEDAELATKKKRRRKHKSGAAVTGAEVMAISGNESEDHFDG